MTRRRKRMLKLLLILPVAYVAWGTMLFLLQGRFIFPRHVAVHTLEDTPPDARAVWINTPDGERVEGWYFTPVSANAATSPAPAVIFCHGNGELIDNNVELARAYAAKGLAVLLPEYRGYGRSSGTPSQRKTTEDLVAFHDWLVEQPEVNPDHIILHGRSLGGGFAFQLAAKRPPAAVIAESTFVSIASFARRFGLPGATVRHPFRSDAIAPTLEMPILLLHGTDDELVPITHARRLAALAPDATLHELPGTHNAFPADPHPYWQAIDELLTRVTTTTP